MRCLLIIWYIHGAGASNRSFAWLHEQLPDMPAQFFSYTLRETAHAAIQRLSQTVAEDGRRAVLVGHSLGGIMAIAATAPNIAGCVTLCAPFGGARHVEFLSMFYSHPLLSDLRYHSRLLREVRAAPATKPHLAIVGTEGLPFFTEENDGVVTVASQTARTGVHYVRLSVNHFEVLLSRDVVDLIRAFAGEAP